MHFHSAGHCGFSFCFSHLDNMYFSINQNNIIALQCYPSVQDLDGNFICISLILAKKKFPFQKALFAILLLIYSCSRYEGAKVMSQAMCQILRVGFYFFWGKYANQEHFACLCKFKILKCSTVLESSKHPLPFTSSFVLVLEHHFLFLFTLCFFSFPSLRPCCSP